MNSLSKYAVVLLAAGMMFSACEDDKTEVEYKTGPNDGLQVTETVDPESDGYEMEREVEGTTEIAGSEVEVDSQAQLEYEQGEGFEADRALEMEGEDFDIDQQASAEMELQDDGEFAEDGVIDRVPTMEEDEQAVLGDEEAREFDSEYEAPADDEMAVGDEVTVDQENDLEVQEDSDIEIEGEEVEGSAETFEPQDEPVIEEDDSAMLDDSEPLQQDDEFAMDEPEIAEEDAWHGEGVAAGDAPTPADDELAMGETHTLDQDLAAEDERSIDRIEDETGATPAPLYDDEPQIAANEDLDTDVDVNIDDRDEIEVWDDQDDTAVLGDEEVRDTTEVDEFDTSPAVPEQERDQIVLEDEPYSDPYATEPVGEMAMEDEPYLSTPVGMSFLVGGGVNGYVGEADDFTGTGGNWEARYVAGTRTILGGELAYHGTANEMQTLGVEDNAILMSNGAEGALRVNLLTQDWQPYVVGGVGWKHFNVTNTDTNTSDIRNSDDALTVPVGAGLAYRFNNVVADVRGMYRPAFLADITRTGGDEDTNLDTINGSLNIGFEF